MSSTTDRRTPGVNLIGYLRAESGVGELGRSWLATLDAAGIAVAPILYGNTRSRQEHALAGVGGARPFYDVNLVSINADQVPVFAREHGPDLLAGRYSIGIWAWEVEEFPEWMALSERWLQEVWALSNHAAEAIRPRVRIPVHAVLPAIDPPPPEPPPLDLDGPQTGPRFLCSFDFESVVDRKNPQGVVRAYVAAFPKPAGARLWIKSVNGALHPEALARLRELAAGRPDIRVFDGYLSRREQSGLLDACDVFVSLHRAEGLGLMLAEAMWLGKPVVATAYSGNLDFMDAASAVLIPWERVPSGEGRGPYSGTWAEPSVAAAADALRRFAAEPALAAAIGRRARQAVRARMAPEARAAEVRRRLDAALPADARTPLDDRDGPLPAFELPAGPRRELERHLRAVERARLGATRDPARRIAEIRWRQRHHELLMEGLRRRLRRLERREREASCATGLPG